MEAAIDFFTDPLRLTLLAAAVVVLLGILVFGRFGIKPTSRTELSQQEINEALTRNDDDNVVVKSDLPAITREPGLPSKLDDIETPTIEPAFDNPRMTKAADSVIDTEIENVSDDNHESDEQDQFIVIHIIAPEGKAFSGAAISEAMEKCQMVFGDFNIFHYPHPQDESLSLFSCVNMLKPGFFNKDTMNDIATTGLSFFMRMPVMPGHHLDVFTTMLATAQNLSRILGGQIMDEHRVPLTQGLVESIKEDIIRFEQQNAASGEQTS